MVSKGANEAKSVAKGAARLRGASQRALTNEYENMASGGAKLID
jgi:hypothetical protein